MVSITSETSFWYVNLKRIVTSAVPSYGGTVLRIKLCNMTSEFSVVSTQQ